VRRPTSRETISRSSVKRRAAGGAEGVGYLLKDRVHDVNQFRDAVRRVAAGQQCQGRFLGHLLEEHEHRESGHGRADGEGGGSPSSVLLGGIRT